MCGIYILVLPMRCHLCSYTALRWFSWSVPVKTVKILSPHICMESRPVSGKSVKWRYQFLLVNVVIYFLQETSTFFSLSLWYRIYFNCIAFA